ncbi:MAG: sugar transferase [Deltaproteobacteria bacterium]|nr:sugar transferase [Deltaproteobacteria bacterium]
MIEQRARILEAIHRAGSLPWRTGRLRRIAKRALDLAIAAPAAVAALPVMGAVAAFVRAVDPTGPVIFRQPRVGLDGRTFTMWKFRTMRSETPAGAVRARGEVTRGDPRLIPGGALLRDWRLDELPQLLHVLSGRMSLVGPRPDLPDNLAAYPDDLLVRFAMPPGCTAWTFTRGAFANDWTTRQAINADYVRRWSIGLDLRVLAGTAWVLLAQRHTAPAVAEVPGGSPAGTVN